MTNFIINLISRFSNNNHSCPLCGRPLTDKQREILAIKLNAVASEEIENFVDNL